MTMQTTDNWESLLGHHLQKLVLGKVRKDTRVVQEQAEEDEGHKKKPSTMTSTQHLQWDKHY